MRADLLRFHIVEQQEARIFVRCLCLHGPKSFGGCERSSLAPHFNFDERRALARAPNSLDCERSGIFFAARDQRQMIVFN